MQAKNLRTLDMYVRFCEGKVISKAEEAERFGVDPRSVQRDIDDIRAFLDERNVHNSSGMREIVYDRTRKGFVMTGAEGSAMSNSEILAVSKILLESRAFTKKEMSDVLKKLVEGCVPLKNMKLVSDLLANERYHYVELHHKSIIQNKLWELGANVKECNVLEISYRKQGGKELVRRIVEPVSIIFSEYYFYLNAYIAERDDQSGKLCRKYDYPAIFRVDRIERYKKTGERFRTEYAQRFEDGEFRKRVQFMYPGKLMRLRFRYSGSSIEAILDRLPTASVIAQGADSWTVEAQVYGKGVLMWLLGQGSNVEVLQPEDARRQMKEMLAETMAHYL